MCSMKTFLPVNQQEFPEAATVTRQAEECLRVGLICASINDPRRRGLCHSISDPRRRGLSYNQQINHPTCRQRRIRAIPFRCLDNGFTQISTISMPPSLCTISMPPSLCTISMPPSLRTFSMPPSLCTISMPPSLYTIYMPPPLCTISMPPSLCTISMPPYLCKRVRSAR